MKSTKEKGITLIALIITVIIMIILAGIGLNFAFGEHGILRKADEVAKLYQNSADNELNTLNQIEKEFDRIKDKVTEEIKLAINFIDGNTGELIKGNATISIYTDSECKNLLKQINITSKDASEEYTYKTGEALESRVYYIRVDQAPEGCTLMGEDIVQKEVKPNANFTIWNLLFFTGNVPTYGYDIGVLASGEVPAEGYDESIINFEIESMIGDTSIQPEIELNEGVEIYEIAKYDEVKNQYTYINGMEKYNLPELSNIDIQEIQQLAYLGVNHEKNNMMKMIEEAIRKEQNVLTSLKVGEGNGVYLIRPKEEVCDSKYKYRFEPLLIVPTLRKSETGNKYSNFTISINWKHDMQYGKLKIVNDLQSYNESLKGANVVYDIIAENDGEIVYSDIVVETIKSKGQITTLIENLPAGSSVTVDNVYCSPGYGLISDKVVPIEIFAEETKTVEYNYELNLTEEENNKYGKAYVNIKNIYDKNNSKWKLYNSNSYKENLEMNVRIEGARAFVSIKNIGAKTCFVRLKPLSKASVVSNGEQWEMSSDEYYSYNTVLQSNETTKEIEINIEEIEKEFNTVIVVEGITPSYDDDGTTYAQW